MRSMAGRPLFAWSLGQAIASECFDAIYVTSDSPAEIRKKIADEFSWMDRADEVDKVIKVLDYTATTASIDSALLEFQQNIPFDVVCLIGPASPLTRAEDFRAARHRFLSESLDSLLTAVRSKRFLWTRAGVPIDHVPGECPSPQDLEGYLVENGAFCLTGAKSLRDHGCRYRFG
ncbi:MAG: phosphatase, partial [Betaproteobacteria bacterium]|nr:phosphatase [Betaproteobacteria bacterium]